MRFTKGAYVFAKVPPDDSRSLKRIGSDFSDTMRYRWVEAVAAADLANAGIVMRDWRRTTATDGGRAAFQSMTARICSDTAATSPTGIHSQTDGLRERMERHVWSSQQQAAANQSAVA
jgi:hypothetical protein